MAVGTVPRLTTTQVFTGKLFSYFTTAVAVAQSVTGFPLKELLA
jgi:hypothetical protein